MIASHTAPRTVRIAAIGGAALVAASVIAIATPASAHDYVVSSTPEDGGTITTVPDEFSVTMSANVLDLAGDGSASGLLVTDAAGLYYGDGCSTVSGPTLSMPATLGEAGTYSLVWQVVSSDSHPTSGELTFEYAPAAGTTATPGSESVPVCGETVTTPEETASAEPTDAASETASPDSSSTATDDDMETSTGSEGGPLLWIGTALIAVAVAVSATFAFIRKRPKD